MCCATEGVDGLFNDVVYMAAPVLHPMNTLLLLLLLFLLLLLLLLLPLLVQQQPKHLLATRLPIFTTLFLFSAVFGDEVGD